MKKLLAVLSIALLVVGAVTIFSMAEDTAAPGPSRQPRRRKPPLPPPWGAERSIT